MKGGFDMADGEVMRFPTELKHSKYEVERIARRFGLSFPQIVYTLVTMEEMSEVVAYGGYPVVPHHWRHGQESIMGKKQHKYGLGRVFEIVALTRPMYGYLMDSNPYITQASVMAHVCGHGDMFENNVYNKLLNQEILNIFANDAVQYDEYCRTYGIETVKKFIDRVLSCEWLVDQDALLIRRRPKRLTDEERGKKVEERRQVRRITPSEDLAYYMDEFLNPPEWIEAQRQRIGKELEESSKVERGMKVPSKPVKDVLKFIMLTAPLEQWQRNVISMVLRYVYHVACFGRTKFMHEGWSALWEERILNEPSVMKCDLSIFAQQMAMVQWKSPMNPYEITCNLWLDVEYRWNTGRHGSVWDECNVQDVKDRWDHFIVFRNLRDEVVGNEELLTEKWHEFLAFGEALKRGELGYPKEFFVRNFFTSEILIPTWVHYQSAEEDLKDLKARLSDMERIEKGLESVLEELKAEADKEGVKEEDLVVEARRVLYLRQGLVEDVRYWWSISEVEREIVYREKLVAFRDAYKHGEREVPHFSVPDSWGEWIKRFPGSTELGIGTKQMFDVREVYDDYSFMEEFFTKDFCEKHKYFLMKQKTVWDWNAYPDKKAQHWVLDSRAYQRIRNWMLFRFTNFFQPVIRVRDANHNNNRELFLEHVHNGVDLDWLSKDGRYVKDVLENIFHLWGGEKTVHIETVRTKKEEDKPWWFYWYQTQEKKTDDWPQELTGHRVIFSWGPHAQYPTGQVTEFYEQEFEEVKYKTPY